MMSWKTFVPPQLRNSSIKLEDKIAWIKTALWHPDNSTLFIPNKFQVVCDWVVDQLITISRRSQDRGAATQMLWELFDSILPTMSNHGTVKALILQALAERMLQVIKADNHQNTGFQDEMKILLSCCGSLFNKQANLNIDIASLNIEGLATFLASFIALWIVSTKNENSFSETILNLLLCIIQYTNRMLSQQSNQKKVFVVYCELLLANNIVLRYSLRQLLTSQMPYNTKLLENVLNAVERLLAGILFHRDHLTDYQMGFRHPVSNSGRELNLSYHEILFRMLNLIRNEDTELCRKISFNLELNLNLSRSALVSLPFIYEQYLQSSREMKKIVTSAEFNFYVELVKLIQLEKMFDQNQTIRQNTASAFNALTDIVIKFDIYQPSVDSVAGNTQLTWMKNRCEDLVGRINMDVLSCLRTFLKLNYRSMESHLVRILSFMFTSDDSVNEVIDTKDGIFLVQLLSTYSKLHQVDKLLSILFTCFRTILENSDMVTVFNLPVNFLTRFEQCIRELTPTSAIDVGNLISGEICEYYLSKFVGENSEERKLNGVFYSCMQHAITLLCCCLLNSKILTTSQSDLPLSVKKSVIDFLQSCCHKVVMPLRQCMAETTRKDYEFISYVQFSALLMSYTLLEVFTAFQCNGKEIPTDMYNAIISLQWKDKRIQVVNWSQRQCDLALENFKIRYLLTIYAVQRSVYSLLMPQNEEQSFVFEDYLYFINELPFNKNDLLINDVNSEDNANLDSSPVALMLVINEKTFPLYSWKLLLDKLPFYIAYLNNSQILDICRSLIKTMYSCPNSCTTKRNSSYYSISCGAIMQATLIDLQPFQSCLMSCILDEMKQLFNPIRNSLNLQSVVFEALGNLARPSFEWQSALHYPSSDDKASKSVNSEAWDIIEHAQRLIGASEMRWCIIHKPLHSEELSSLNDMHRLIKIFYMLPLDCLLPVNYTRCFLSLICWDWIISGALETEIDWRYRLQQELRQIMWLLLNPRVTLINTCHRFLKRLNPLTVLDNHLLTDLSSLNSKNASADRRVSSKETKELHKITTDIVSSAFRNWLGGKTLLKFASNLIKQLRPRIDDFVQEIMQVSSTSEIEQVILEHSLLLKFIFSVLEQIALSQEAVAIFNQERDNFIILFKICGHILYQSDEVPKTKRLKLSKASKIKSKDGRIVEAKGDVVNIFKSCRILIDIFRLLLQLVEPNVEFSFNQEIHDLYKIAFQELSNFASDLVPLLEDTVLINDSALCTSYVMYTSTFLEYHHYETNDEETSNTVNNFITLLLKLLTQSNGLRNSSSTKIDNHQINEVAEFRNCLQQAIVKLVVKSFSRENTSTFDNLLCETKTVSDNLILDLSNLKVRLYVWTELIAKLTIERKKAEYKDAFSTLLLTLVRMSYNLEGMSNKLLDSETCLLILKLIKQLLTQGKNSLTRDAVRSAFQICSTWPYEKNCISSNFPDIFDAISAILSAITFNFPNLAYKNLAICVASVRMLLVHFTSRINNYSPEGLHQLSPLSIRNCILCLTRLYGDISKQKELAGKARLHLVADYIYYVSPCVLEFKLKQLLHEGIFQIIEFCHDSDFTYLNSCVKETMKDSLKALHADYLKFYKFTGKI